MNRNAFSASAFFRRVVVFAFGLLTLASRSGGQQLADVLSSLQERKLVLEQAQAFVREYSGSGDIPGFFHPIGPSAGAFELISWTGLSARFPSNEDVTALTIEQHVNLLNEARRNFQIIRAGYVNVLPARLDGSPQVKPPAVINRFDELSLPTPPVANPANYLQVLRELACAVDALRVTPWPVAFTVTTGTSEPGDPDKPQSQGNDLMRGSEASSTTTSVRTYWASELPVQASLSVWGENSQQNIGTAEHPVWKPRENRNVRRIWPTSCKFAYVPDSLTLPSGVSPVVGKCVILASHEYTPFLQASKEGPNDTPIPRDGAYKVLASYTSPLTYPLATPVWAVSGSWVASGDPDTAFIKDKQVFQPDHIDGASYVDVFYGGDSYRYKCVLQNIVSLLVPSFSKGLDKLDSEGHTASFLWDRPAVTGDAGRLVVSGGAEKLAVDAGAGRTIFSGASVQIQNGFTDRWTFGGAVTVIPPIPEVLWGNPKESLQYVDYFTDGFNHRRMPMAFGSDLKFVGPERDYEAIYETRFDHGRSDLESWTEDTPFEGNASWINGRAYFHAWQAPRLRQIIGREAVIDIVTGADDYTHAISVYRIPVEHNLTRDADGFVVLTGLELLKTVSVRNPTVGTNGFPAGEVSMEVEADGGKWSVQGGYDDFGNVLDWDLSLHDIETSNLLLEESWSNELDYSVLDSLSGIPVAYEAPIVDSLTIVRSLDGQPGTSTTQTLSYDSTRSLYADPLPRVSRIEIDGPGGAGSLELGYVGGDNAAEFPISLSSSVDGSLPEVVHVKPSGLPEYQETGGDGSKWRTEWSPSAGGGKLLVQSSYGGAVFARQWIKWEDGGNTVTTYSAPDGNEEDPEGDTSVAWSKLEFGKIGGDGFPGLPHKLTRSDGSGTTWDWTISQDGSAAMDLRDGLISEEGEVSSGVKLTSQTNQRGYQTGSAQYFLNGGTLQLSGSSVPADQITSWGAPRKSVDFTTNLSSSWSFDGIKDLLASFTGPLGVTTATPSRDALDRPKSFTWKGHSGGISYNQGGFGASYTLNIPGRTVNQSTNFDCFGRVTAASTTAGGTFGVTLDHAASGTTATTSDSVTGASSITKQRIEDGSLDQKTGSMLPFGGLSGTALSIDGGLFKSTTQVSGLTACFQTTWTDAWGRVRKVSAPGTGGGTDETLYEYSDPGSQTKRVVVKDAAGRWLVEESEPWAAAGPTIRSGIHLGGDDGHDSLEAGDRFTTTVVSIVGGKLRTTITVTGESVAPLVQDYDPATGKTETVINGGEQSVTQTPNFAAKTEKTEVKRAGTTVETVDQTFNHLGQAESIRVSGAGVADTTVTAEHREDGSLERVEASTGGWTSGFELKADGTLETVTDPVRGDLPVTHTFNGDADTVTETVTVAGVTTVRKLDGTESSVSGATVTGYGRDKVEAVTGGFTRTLTPHEGSATTTTANAAGAAVSHDYGSGPARTMTWNAGGLPATASLARGGSLAFGYSNDGAKDLTSVTWPQVNSGPWTVPGGGAAYSYNTAGLVSGLGDASGTRSLGYNQGRLENTEWTAGPLAGYRVKRVQTGDGRLQGVEVYKGSSTTPLHSFSYGYNGAGDEIATLGSGSFSATIGRRDAGETVDRADRAIVKVARGTVEQYWKRGAGGRVVEAGSNVAGAPDFDYVPGSAAEVDCFDAWGRRLKCATGGGTWAYTYGTAGQLQSAEHSRQGSFNYDFDGIGRRNGGTDTLNRFTTAVNTVAPRLEISVNPGTQLSFNGVPQATVGGHYTHVFAPPGATGVWEPWDVLAVRTGAGDARANPDAEAEQHGAVWIPPAAETFDYDADGNRQSSAHWQYGWDALNRLVRARTKDYATAPEGWDVGFSYDAEGRRFKKTVTHKSHAAGGQTVTRYKEVLYVWDGWDLLYERHQDVQGNALLERKYVWGPDLGGRPFAAGGAGGLLLMRESRRGAAATDYYPLYDGSGHVTGLATATGELVAAYAYGPFGERIGALGPMANANPWRYATKYYDEETGLYYFGHRYYDPGSGQWLSRELLGEDESINLYSYCHNDPVNKVDLLGLEEQPATGNPIGWDPQKGYWENSWRNIKDLPRLIGWQNNSWQTGSYLGDVAAFYTKDNLKNVGVATVDHLSRSVNTIGHGAAKAGAIEELYLVRLMKFAGADVDVDKRYDRLSGVVEHEAKFGAEITGSLAELTGSDPDGVPYYIGDKVGLGVEVALPFLKSGPAKVLKLPPVERGIWRLPFLGRIAEAEEVHVGAAGGKMRDCVAHTAEQLNAELRGVYKENYVLRQATEGNIPNIATAIAHIEATTTLRVVTEGMTTWGEAGEGVYAVFTKETGGHAMFGQKGSGLPDVIIDAQIKKTYSASPIESLPSSLGFDSAPLEKWGIKSLNDLIVVPFK